MVTTEKEVRIAVQAVLIAVFVFYGFYGCAIAMVVIMLPWKPFLATGYYLVQPIIDWREREERRHQEERSIASRLEALSCDSEDKDAAPDEQSPEPPQANEPLLPTVSVQAAIEAERAVQPAIETHLKKCPNVLLGNMEMEVEEVKVTGDTAEALVKFQSMQVRDLAFEVRYLLRRVGDHWEVESSSPANGTGKSRQAGLTVSVPLHAPAVPAPRPEIRDG